MSYQKRKFFTERRGLRDGSMVVIHQPVSSCETSTNNGETADTEPQRFPSAGMPVAVDFEQFCDHSYCAERWEVRCPSVCKGASQTQYLSRCGSIAATAANFTMLTELIGVVLSSMPTAWLLSM
jgi:hypothetical protein